MRLIDVRTMAFQNFGDLPPPYAILSHRWGDKEMSYQTFQDQAKRRGRGFQKITDFCKLVRHSREFSAPRKDSLPHPTPLEWAWVDTVCIDKSSSAELSEAINSMWKYYSRAEYCVAYLSDILHPREGVDSGQHFTMNPESGFESSKWFTRGWTLQELLAPKNVVFYDRAWHRIGSKYDLARSGSALTQASGVEAGFLQALQDVSEASVAQRMSWASRRMTSREEDIAYSLMGLFDVNMPLLYGEGGEKAFQRLQREILMQSDDESIFVFEGSDLLACSPSEFQNSGNVQRAHRVAHPPYTITNKGLHFEGPMLRLSDSSILGGGKAQCYVIKLNCIRLKDPPTDSNAASKVQLAKGCLLIVTEISGRFYRSPRDEKAALNMSSGTFSEQQEKGTLRKLDSHRLYIQFSSTTKDTSGSNLRSSRRSILLADAEGPWYLGNKEPGSKPAST